ncbi:MAG: serine hydrolase domain-containing protein [Cytophagales bacterium]|nr:serine hydrolase domain-containing protein [Cytophagales bacterium]
MNKTSLSLLILTAIIACQSKPDRKQMISEELNQVYQDYELMGMSVALIAKGQLYYSGSFGYENVLPGDPMTPETYVRIASISKMYTALAVMTLWEKGLLDLDTPASVYLGWELKHPVFPEQPITLRHLMDHRSGIRDGTGYGNFLRNMIDKEADIRSLFQVDGAYYTEDMFANEPPGVYFSYTNCTWGLIASMIENVSGQRFDLYCKENLFKPMGVRSSFNVMDLEPEEIAPLFRTDSSGLRQAQVDDFSSKAPVERSYPNYQPGQNGLIYGPQGSLRTSLNDLWVTANMFMNEGKANGNQIIKPATLSYFQQDQWTYDGENGDTWGNFWHAYTKGMHFIQNKANGDIIFPDRILWGHPGIAYGLLSDFYIDLETRSGVIFFTSGSQQEFEYAEGSSFYEVETDVFKVLYPHLQAIESAP